MNKLIISLLIFVLFVLAMGFYLLNPDEEKNNAIQDINSKETINSKKISSKSEPANSKSHSYEKNIPLEDIEHYQNTSKIDALSSDSIMTPNHQFKSDLVPNQEKTLPSLDANPETMKVKAPLNKNNQSSSEDIAVMPEKNISSEDVQDFHVIFSVEYSNESSKAILVNIPIKTHVGLIEKFAYSAKLENGHFSIKWEMPGWIQIANHFPPIKDVQFTYNSLTYSNLLALKEFSRIHVYKKFPIELTFETSDNTLIPDGTKIKFSENDRWIENYTPIISNQKGTIYIQPGQIAEVTSMSIGHYFSEKFFIDSAQDVSLTKTILLKKKIPFYANIQDQNNKPLLDYYVLFSKTDRPFGLDQLLSDFEKTGELDETKLDPSWKIDNNGDISGEAENTGEYYATIFGPNANKGIVKTIIIPSDNSKINIQVNVSTATIKLHFTENGKPFQGELIVDYQNNNYRGGFQKEIGTSTFILSQLQPGKLILHLNSKVFINSTTEIILPADGDLEKVIELKPGAFLSGTVTSNNNPILGQKLYIRIYEKGFSQYCHKGETDIKGRFQFTGLNPEKIYIFHVDMQTYKLDPAVAVEYRSSQNEVFINLIEKQLLLGKVIDEKGNSVEIKHIATSFSRDGKIVYGDHSHTEKNQFSIPINSGDTISFCIQTADFVNHYQTLVFEPSQQTNPLVIILKKGLFVKGIALDTNNKPLFAGLVIDAFSFDFGYCFSNKIDGNQRERTALGDGGTFQIENAQIGERYYVLSKDNSPIPFTVEEKHRHELIELKATKSYSFSGNLRSQKNILQEGRRINGERIDSNERVVAFVDAKGNFYLNCLRPGKWVFTSNFRDMYKVVPRIEIEIIDKDETFDWVVFR